MLERREVRPLKRRDDKLLPRSDLVSLLSGRYYFPTTEAKVRYLTSSHMCMMIQRFSGGIAVFLGLPRVGVPFGGEAWDCRSALVHPLVRLGIEAERLLGMVGGLLWCWHG